jgi:ribosomal protein L37AE/L43A
MDGSNHIRYGKVMPDMKYVNREIPILEVARELGLAVRSRKTTCPECKKKLLTFSVKFNRWRCWHCDPAGKQKTVIDLVMFILNVDAFNAAAWISKCWNVVRQVQVERSENQRGLEKHVYSRKRQIPVPERDKPNLQAMVTSPGWREMALSARVVAMTLLALARMDEKNSVTINRKGLSYLTGITDPNTLAKANRELQAIGLFEVDRGYRTKYAERPTVYRLTWWSQVFQRWLKAGYAVPEITIPTTTDTTNHHGTSTSGGFPLPPLAAERPPSEAQNNLLDAPGSAMVSDLRPLGQAV